MAVQMNTRIDAETKREGYLVIAAALRSKADFLISCDEKLLRHPPVAARLPTDMVSYLETHPI
ncbi:MAG: hypothetical protein Q4A93_07520 [Actinomycetota bacterium]|nr:hypothetical protein [Actinomycetota bacterium]